MKWEWYNILESVNFLHQMPFNSIKKNLLDVFIFLSVLEGYS